MHLGVQRHSQFHGRRKPAIAFSCEALADVKKINHTFNKIEYHIDNRNIDAILAAYSSRSDSLLASQDGQ